MRPRATGRRGVSIGTLCAVVAVAAVDFGWWKHITQDSGQGTSYVNNSLMRFRGPAYDAAVMPMMSLLLVGFAHFLGRRGKVARWFAGFLIGGLAGLGLYVGYCYACLAIPSACLDTSWPPMRALMDNLFGTEGELRFFYVIMLCFAPPQFIPATLGAIVAALWKPKARASEIPPHPEPSP